VTIVHLQFFGMPFQESNVWSTLLEVTAAFLHPQQVNKSAETDRVVFPHKESAKL